jgi:hypothetical protein
VVCPAQDQEEEVGPWAWHGDNRVHWLVILVWSDFSISTFISRNQVVGM